MSKNLIITKIVLIFVLLGHDRAEMPEHNEGFFVPHKDKDAALPCLGYNDLNSPVEGLSKGPDGIPYFLPSTLKNSTMQHSVSVYSDNSLKTYSYGRE